MTKIFGLPAHPLFVHGPIVLLPILAVVTIVAAVRPAVRRTLGVWLPSATFVLFVMILAAMNTGEALDRAIDLGTAVKHARLARTTRLLTFLLLLATGALWAVGRRVDRAPVDQAAPSRRSPVLLGCAAAAVVLSALSTVWVVRTGHEGARIHWDGVIKQK